MTLDKGCIDVCEKVFILRPERLWTIHELDEAKRNLGGSFPNCADVQIAC